VPDKCRDRPRDGRRPPSRLRPQRTGGTSLAPVLSYDNGSSQTLFQDFRASGPRNGTRRGLTLELRIGPISSQAASTRPPQVPEQRMRRSTSPTVESRP
jgi:hypothetical protein